MRSFDRLQDIVNSLNTHVIDADTCRAMQRAVQDLTMPGGLCDGCAYNMVILINLHPSQHIRDLAQDTLEHQAQCMKRQHRTTQ